jgi:hypothetical protein
MRLTGGHKSQEDGCLVGCSAVQTGTSLPTIHHPDDGGNPEGIHLRTHRRENLKSMSQIYHKNAKWLRRTQTCESHTVINPPPPPHTQRSTTAIRNFSKQHERSRKHFTATRTHVARAFHRDIERLFLYVLIVMCQHDTTKQIVWIIFIWELTKAENSSFVFILHSPWFCVSFPQTVGGRSTVICHREEVHTQAQCVGKMWLSHDK